MSSKSYRDSQFIPKGTIVIREGAPADYAYLIQSGRMQVFVNTLDGEVEIATLGPGQFIGEMALMSKSPRTASVRALEDSNLIVITPVVFREKLDKSDPMIKAITKMLIERVLQANAKKVEGE